MSEEAAETKLSKHLDSLRHKVVAAGLATEDELAALETSIADARTAEAKGQSKSIYTKEAIAGLERLNARLSQL